MAEGGENQLKFFWYSETPSVVDVTDCTVGQDSNSQEKRSVIVLAIIKNHHTGHLRKILDSGWDVNEILYRHWIKRTALHDASEQGWTEGVKLLFDAGANYKTPGIPYTPLYLALQNPICPVDIIDLLLKHGADPNDHDGDCIPLFQALSGTEINENFMKIVQLLVNNGADPNVTYKNRSPSTAVGKALDCLCTKFKSKYGRKRYVNSCKENAALFKTLLIFGADINCKDPLLHKILGSERRKVVTPGPDPPILTIPHYIFLQEHLDIYFLYGGNIHKEYGDLGTGLEFAVRECCHSNSIHWLIRHGADTSTLKFHYLRGVFVSSQVSWQVPYHTVKTPLILLQAGMRVPQGTRRHLINLENESSYEGRNAIWEKLKKEEISMRFKKHIFPEYLSKQMVDLEEFSDESLKVYPEVNYPDDLDTHIKHEEFALAQICMMLEFLSQPQSLQWYCRHCVRENLVSLQPSVVRTLPLPSKMKRYILCHEI